MTRIRSLALLPMTLLLLCAGGCGWFRTELGYPGEYLLVANDALAVPGETVCLCARARKGTFFRDQEHVALYYFKDGRIYSIVKADDEGEANIPFTPTKVGDYIFDVEYYPRDLEANQPLRVEILVTCREPNTPLFITDIDSTLIDPRSRARMVLEGDPTPLEGAAESVQQLAKDFVIIYLTARPDYLGLRTRNWLSLRGFPRGPVFMSRIKTLVDGNEKYKATQLAEIREKFKGPAYGIGDRLTDIEAYIQAGVQPILLSPLSQPPDADFLREEVKTIDALPPGTAVVETWAQAMEVAKGKQFPAGPAKEKRVKLLEQLKGKPPSTQPFIAMRQDEIVVDQVPVVAADAVDRLGLPR